MPDQVCIPLGASKTSTESTIELDGNERPQFNYNLQPSSHRNTEDTITGSIQHGIMHATTAVHANDDNCTLNTSRIPTEKSFNFNQEEQAFLKHIITYASASDEPKRIDHVNDHNDDNDKYKDRGLTNQQGRTKYGNQANGHEKTASNNLARHNYTPTGGNGKRLNSGIAHDVNHDNLSFKEIGHDKGNHRNTANSGIVHDVDHDNFSFNEICHDKGNHTNNADDKNSTCYQDYGIGKGFDDGNHTNKDAHNSSSIPPYFIDLACHKRHGFVDALKEVTTHSTEMKGRNKMLEPQIKTTAAAPHNTNGINGAKPVINTDASWEKPVLRQ